jgi:hypothetical protein
LNVRLKNHHWKLLERIVTKSSTKELQFTTLQMILSTKKGAANQCFVRKITTINDNFGSIISP